jgi:hypothetical protein
MSMAMKKCTKWIHVICKSSNHGHKRNTQWIHANVYHFHEWIHSGAMSHNIKEDIWSQTDPLQVPILKKVIQSI